jgi:hypothetical protein
MVIFCLSPPKPKALHGLKTFASLLEESLRSWSNSPSNGTSLMVSLSTNSFIPGKIL